MGTITSGVGIVSGIDYQSMIDQLMAIEAQPRDQLTTRISNINAQKTAYQGISAHITALLSRINVLTQLTSFRAATATSSAPDILSATVGSGLQPGSYSFIVRALASTHQFVSRGFQDRSTPLETGVLTIESAQARVNSSTRLEELNGHTGVRRGSFKIINGTQQATINISDALTVGDVLDQINNAGIQVRASIDGDGLVLEDTSGTSTDLRVQEVDNGKTAADLGFVTGHTYSATGELAGQAVIYLAESTPISALNDGLGMSAALAGNDFTIDAGGQNIGVSLNDIIATTTRLGRLNHGQGVRLGQIRVTSRDGTSTTIDLSGAQTIGDVKTALEGAFGGSRISVVTTGSRLVINDNTDISKLEDDQKSDFILEDLSGHTARDLGIDGDSATGKINGRDVLHMDNVGDVLSAINYATSNADASGAPIVTATLAADGHGLELHTTSGSMVITGPGAGARSHALLDLGFQEGTYADSGTGAVATGNRIVGSLDTVLLKTLNGGAGVTGTTLQIDANGTSAVIDLTGAQTLADVIQRINQATGADGSGLGVEATYDATGTRLVVNNLLDESPISISGDFADALGLTQTGTSIKSANLQRQYVGAATRLDSLNMGRGVALGRFKITNSKGVTASVDLSSSANETVQDVIDAINHAGIGVQATINATGDGLLLTDTSGGAGTMKVEEDGGTLARDLNILGSATNGQIDGSYEFHLDIGGSDTVQTLAARIGTETTLAPYRLNISSRVSGSAGALIIDDSQTDLGVSALAPAQDARVFFGGNTSSGVLLTSSTNTFDSVVDGLTFTASGVSDQPVTVTVNRDLDTLVTTLQGLVDDYNSAVDSVSQAGAYDAETQTAGVLQGEGTLYTIESRLSRLFVGTIYASGPYTRLSDVGITSSDGGHFSFDEDKFRAAYEANPEAVERLFTDDQFGVAVQIKNQINQITDTDGLIPHATATLTDNTDVLQQRVDELNGQLDRKRARLTTEFQNMEAALAQLQSQQAALASLTALASSTSIYSSSTQS